MAARPRLNFVEYGNSKTTTLLPSAKCTRPLFQGRTGCGGRPSGWHDNRHMSASSFKCRARGDFAVRNNSTPAVALKRLAAPPPAQTPMNNPAYISKAKTFYPKNTNYDMQAPVAVRCLWTNCYTLPLPFYLYFNSRQ